MATQSEDRFKIIFKKASALPVTFTSIRANETSGNINVVWQVDNQSDIKDFELQRSEDGVHFSTIATIRSKNTSSTSITYSSQDTEPVNGANFYRVRSNGANGEVKYSSIVKVTINSPKAKISVYPNPVLNGEIHIHFNQFEKGVYRLRLINSLGQEMISKTISKNEGAGGTIVLNQRLVRGKYQLQILKPDGSIENIAVVY